jgi:hypothetical protein
LTAFSARKRGVAADVLIGGAAAAAECLPLFLVKGDVDHPITFGGCYRSADEDIGATFRGLIAATVFLKTL